LAFGVSGVLRKPVESARQYGLIGIAPGLGRAFVGFIVQPLSGALDFFSLTVDGISASFMRCVNIISNKSVPQRIRDPRAIHRDGIIREYDKVEAAGQVRCLFQYCPFLFLLPFCEKINVQKDSLISESRSPV
jgi:vacuolar protein sorting-associated protein 13A/C